MNDKQKSIPVSEYFNSVARRYDFMNTLLSFGIHLWWKQIAVNMLELFSGDRVIDVCGGTGDLSVLAAKKTGNSGHVVLYDINRMMMVTGKSKSSQEEIRKQIDYIQGDAQKMPFPDNCFDAAMVGFGIRNVTNMEKGFSEMFRVLKPGGKLMCLEFSQPVFSPFRWLYDRYSSLVIPRLGQLLAGSKHAYSYLTDSIRRFPLPDELKKLLETIGFTEVSYRRLTNGIAVIHFGKKKRS